MFCSPSRSTHPLSPTHPSTFTPQTTAAVHGVSGRACERFVRGKAQDTDLAEVLSGFYQSDVTAAFA